MYVNSNNGGPRIHLTKSYQPSYGIESSTPPPGMSTALIIILAIASVVVVGLLAYGLYNLDKKK